MKRSGWLILAGLGGGLAILCCCGLFTLLLMVPAGSPPAAVGRAPTLALESADAPALTPEPVDAPAPTPSARPPTLPRPSATAQTKLPGIGQTVSAGNWEYTVTQVQRIKTLTYSEYGNKVDAKGIFLVVYLTLKNIGNKNFSINRWDFELHDSGGIVYDPSEDFSSYSFTSYKHLADLGDQFVPGLSANTALVFDVNPATKGFTLFLGQAERSIDLGQ